MASDVSTGKERVPVSDQVVPASHVAIVCVTHNSAPLLPDFFGSVPSSADGHPIEIHIADSGSSDSTVDEVRQLSPTTVVHEMDGNRGFAAGINTAVASLKNREMPPFAVVIVNPDVRFHAGTADVLVSALHRRPDAGVTVPRLVGEDGRLQLSLRYRPSLAATWAEAICGGPMAHRLGMPTEVVRDRRSYDAAADVGWATGGFLAVSWACLSAVGEWDESYFLYEEEVDFCLRAIDAGFSVHYTPDAVGVRMLDAGRTAPWIQALMRANRVRHVRKRSGRGAAVLVRTGLLVGDAVRGLAGRQEAKAGLWALTSGAGVERILQRYRPNAHAVLTERSVSTDSSAGSYVDVLGVVRAYAAGADPSGSVPGTSLLDAAQWHHVAALVCSLVDAGPAGDAVRRAHVARSLQQEHALGQVARALGDAGIDWLLLKGAVLSEVVYRVPGVRESSDLDLLVHPEDFERAIETMLTAGARMADVNWPLIRKQERGELALVLPGGVLVDLHWHLINEADVRSEVALETASLFRRARTVQLESCTVRTLDEVDTAVHAAVHAWKSGGDRLKWLLDVQQSAVRVGDEGIVRDRARAMRVEIQTLLMLRRAERVIGGMPAHSPGTDRMARIVLRVDQAVAGRSRIVDPDSPRPMSGRMLLRAARDRPSAGPRVAIRSLRESVRYRLGRSGGETQEELRRPIESTVDREAYFTTVRSHGGRPGRARPHVLILVENLSVPFDRRVWQQSTALVRSGYAVTVISPMGTNQDTEPEAAIDGVRILRYPLRPADGGPAGYLREYSVALWRSARLALVARRSGRIDAVHACNPPDLLLLVGLPFKLLGGTTLVFDHHDLVPELFESRFGTKGGLFYRLAVLFERATFAVADGVISTNESYRTVALTRGRKDPNRVRVVRSAPDLSRFTREEPDDRLRRGRRHLVAYLGVMGPQDGVDFALRALAYLRDDLLCRDVHVVMMGAGDSFDDMVRLRDELGLQDMVEFTGRVSDEFVRVCLSTADVCLAPDPLNPLNDVSTMNKIVEYMAMSRPLVSFDLKEARVSAGEAGVYAVPNDEADFARLIQELLDDPERRRRMGESGRRRVEEQLSWNRSEKSLIEFYDTVLTSDDEKDH